MPNTDPRIDAYIGKSQDFAQSILEHLRSLVHRASPDFEETLKWGMPYFTRNGRPVVMMAAFKAHAVFGFWDAPHMKDSKRFLAAGQTSSMGHLGRIGSLEDLPADRQLLAWIKEAVALSEKNVKRVPQRTGTRKEVLTVPAFFKAALAKNKKAKACFEKLPPSHKREYLLWFTEAKKEETRDRRVAQALEWLSEGKSRNWKYEAR